jgi:hypothetical protein
MGKQGETHLDYMTVLALSSPILLMGVMTRDLMSDANFAEWGIEMLIFPTPIGLDRDDFVIKHALNRGLKLKKIFIDLRFMMN